jgi:hypothetical protein
MTWSSLTPIYMLEIFDIFPVGQETLVAWFWWSVSLVTLHKTTTTSSDILVKSEEDHDRPRPGQVSLLYVCWRSLTTFLWTKRLWWLGFGGA